MFQVYKYRNGVYKYWEEGIEGEIFLVQSKEKNLYI